MKKVLVGNKCNEPGRVITEEEGKKLAKEYKIGFFESSARTGKNVNEVFNYLVKEISRPRGKKKNRRRTSWEKHEYPNEIYFLLISLVLIESFN